MDNKEDEELIRMTANHIESKLPECPIVDNTNKEKENMIINDNDNLVDDVEIEDQPVGLESYAYLSTQDTQMYDKSQKTYSAVISYHCSQCIKPFSCFQDLVKHHEIHIEKILYRCSQCNKTFVNKSALEEHRKKHTLENAYQCSHCGIRFSQKEFLERHLIKHTGDKPYKCCHCRKGFTSRSDMIIHERIHTGEKPFQCRHCDKGFARKSSMTSHELIHNGEKPYKCSHCGKGFVKKKNMIRHELIHTREKIYQCNFCDKWFTNSSDMVKHKEMHKQMQHIKTYKGIDQYNHCGNKSTKSSLTNHAKSHRREKSHQYRSINDDQDHIREEIEDHPIEHTADKQELDVISDHDNHTDVKIEKHPIEHTAVKEEVDVISDYDNHIYVKIEEHPIEHTQARQDMELKMEEYPIKIESCSLHFTEDTENNLHNNHQRIHTEEIHKCNHCGIRFSKREFLDKHLIKHTGKNPYKCCHCGKDFAISTMIIHERIHTGENLWENPYQCRHCGKGLLPDMLS